MIETSQQILDYGSIKGLHKCCQHYQRQRKQRRDCKTYDTDNPAYDTEYRANKEDWHDKQHHKQQHHKQQHQQHQHQQIQKLQYSVFSKRDVQRCVEYIGIHRFAEDNTGRPGLLA